MSFDWQVEQNDEVKARKKYFTILPSENSELFRQDWKTFSHEGLCKHFSPLPFDTRGQSRRGHLKIDHSTSLRTPRWAAQHLSIFELAPNVPLLARK